MKRYIDGHVHLLPRNLLGTKDERFNVVMGTYGRKMLPNGIGALFAPDYLEDSAFTAETLLHVMDNAHVERAVIMQSLCFKMNVDIAEAVQKYPDRLCGAMAIEPADEHCLDEIQALRRMGLRVMKFEMSEPFGYTHPNAYPDLKYDSELMDRVFGLAGELGITVTIDTSPIGAPGYQVEALEKEAKAHPKTKFVICHLGFPYPDIERDSDRYARWSQMISLASNENIWFDIAALPSLYKEERYPYVSAVKQIRKVIDEYGSDKLIWGSDIPGTLVDCTYRQMFDMLEYSGLLSEDELDHIFYRNAEKVYFRSV